MGREIIRMGKESGNGKKKDWMGNRGEERIRNEERGLEGEKRMRGEGRE